MGTSARRRGPAHLSRLRRGLVRLAALVPVVAWLWAVTRPGAGAAGMGPVEALAATGWGLSLLPVHCVPWTRPRRRRRGPR